MSKQSNIHKVILYPESTIHYRLHNHWNHATGRLSEYNGVLPISSQYYVIVPNCKFLGINNAAMRGCCLVPESIKGSTFSIKSNLSLIKKGLTLKSKPLKGTWCNLQHEQSKFYFHWFIDILPRVLFGISYSQFAHADLKYVIPTSVTEWQKKSLELLDLNSSALFSANDLSANGNVSISVDYAICGNSYNHFQGAHHARDRLSLDIYNELSNRIKSNISNLQSYPPTKLLLSRRRAKERRLLNENEILATLKPFGFRLVVLEDFPLTEQIKLFSNATHVVGVHGAGLTNLLFASDAYVLEIHVIEHGIRPEYFQLSTIRNLHYSFVALNAANAFNDVIVDKSLVESFARQYVDTSAA